MTRFLLARHAACAQSEHVLLGRGLDAALDERGTRRAHALAARVAREDPALVLTSPRRRARQTAHAIVARAGCPLQIAAALDALDFGRWSGQSYTALAQDPHWQRWNRERSACRTPAGESIAGVQSRTIDYLHALALGHAGATLALVTHAEIIRSVLLHVLRMPIDEYRRIDVQPASLTVLSMTPAGLHADVINEQVLVDERRSA
jgi:broad specificity phosphatase PhoE